MYVSLVVHSILVASFTYNLYLQIQSFKSFNEICFKQSKVCKI